MASFRARTGNAAGESPCSFQVILRPMVRTCFGVGCLASLLPVLLLEQQLLPLLLALLLDLSSELSSAGAALPLFSRALQRWRP